MDSFEIALTIKNPKNSEDIDTKQELHKLADAIWEKYPRAEVASHIESENSNNMIFEVKSNR